MSIKRMFLSTLVALACSVVLAGCGGGNTCTLTINVNLEGVGTVSRKPNKTSFAPGKKVTITAIPADGYKFVEWTVTVGQAQFTNANNATTTITLGANPTTTIVATFRLDQFNSQIKYDSFKDLRDGHSYRTVKIGNVTWMAENLNFEMESSLCGGVNATNGLKYGRLYMWTNRQNACPAGWLLPTRQDWHNLIQGVGGEQAAGGKLKSARGWQGGGNGTDEFGFSAIPSDKDGLSGSWWSADEVSMGAFGLTNKYYTSINSNDNSISENTHSGGRFHVRCIQLSKEQMAEREREMEQKRQRELQRQEQERQRRFEEQERVEQQRHQQLENQRLQRERQEQQRQQRLEEQRLQRERQQQQRQQRR